MKSILQGIALAAAVILIASCDSSSGSRNSNVITPTPQDGVAGAGVKGVILGGTVTIVDADGDTLATTVTRGLDDPDGAPGTYSVIYDAAEIAGITYPLTITITNPDGTALTICDFVNDAAANPGEDCRTGDEANPFVAFGETYALDMDFELAGLIPEDPNAQTASMFVSPATAIAASIAAANTVDNKADAAKNANNQVLGLISNFSGISFGDTPLNEINIADVTDDEADENPAGLAIAAFAAAVVANQEEGKSLANVIEEFRTAIVDGTPTKLAKLTNGLARALSVIAAKSGNNGIATAAQNASEKSAIFGMLDDDDGPVIFPGPDSDANILATDAFVIKLGQVIGAIADTTGAEGAGSSDSVTETFATELDAVASISSGNATKAFSKLEAALLADAAKITADPTLSPITNAVEAGTAEAPDDGIEYVLTAVTDASGEVETGSFTVTGVSSRWPLMEADGTDGNTVTLTGDTATADATGVTIPSVTLITSQAGVTLQTFTGDFAIVNGSGPDLFTSITLNGAIVGATAGTSFTVAATLSDVDDSGSKTTGTYTFALGFTSASAEDLTLAFNGTIGAELQNFAVTAGSNTIIGTVSRQTVDGVDTDTDVFTDGSISLTLTVVDGVVQETSGVIGNLTFGDVSTGTLGNDGVVTYSDGSIRFLPAVIF
ncbi:MAG: hypothetical protein KUG79_17625 [Pseudomonadales bacterium]|nr:hypothetical protein [Pseudomonadales bacterium]